MVDNAHKSQHKTDFLWSAHCCSALKSKNESRGVAAQCIHDFPRFRSAGAVVGQSTAAIPRKGVVGSGLG